MKVELFALTNALSLALSHLLMRQKKTPCHFTEIHSQAPIVIIFFLLHRPRMDCDGKMMTVALLARGGLLVRGGEALERLRRLLAGGLRLRLVGAAFEQLHLLLELLEVLLEGGGDLGVGEAEAEVRLLDLPVGEVVRAPDPRGERRKLGEEDGSM